LRRSEIYRKKALQCLLTAERLHGPAERLAVLRIAQSWLALANRAACNVVSDQHSSGSRQDAGFSADGPGSEPPPAIPL
jgi:hypothetical protein